MSVFHEDDLKVLRKLLRVGKLSETEHVYARMALAEDKGRGVLLSYDDVFAIIGRDDAVQTVLANVIADTEVE